MRQKRVVDKRKLLKINTTATLHNDDQSPDKKETDMEIFKDHILQGRKKIETLLALLKTNKKL